MPRRAIWNLTLWAVLLLFLVWGFVGFIAR